MPADRHAHDPGLPALERLTRDVAAAMHAAERAPRPRWWRRMPPLVVALLALAVPSAVALHATAGKGDDRSVDVPGPRAAVAIARGVVHGHAFTLAAQRCDDGTTIVAWMLVTGAAGAAGRCASGDGWGRQALSATWSWSPGRTFVFGVVRPGVAAVDLRVVRREGARRLDARWFRVAPRPFDAAAVAQGGLPRALRYVLLYRPRRSELTDAVARDARGRVVYRCAIPGISRTAGSPTAAAARRPCA
jgi:hypothetical protein